MAQSLVELILELNTLASEPQKNWQNIVSLLQSHQVLAEFEVARCFVSKRLEKQLAVSTDHVDPRKRMESLEAIKLLYGRAEAAKALRKLVKDPDSRVMAKARNVAKSLNIPDVALPDSRLRPSKKGPGGWNWTGWAFGTLGGSLGYNTAPRTPTQFPTLAQRGLPALSSQAAVAQLLGLPNEGELAKLMRPGTASGSAYIEFEIPKATGGTRRIAAPRAPLRAAQRIILDQILSKVTLHDAAHGFVKGRSTVTNARPHASAHLVVKTDLKDFFPTVHYRRVKGIFEWLGYSDEIAGVLAGLTTYRPTLPDGTVVWPGMLPQGAPTSPALANLACLRLDARLTGLAKRAKATYTRYADDLTFSFKEEPEKGLGRFLWWVDQICQQEGFVEHAGKRRVYRAHSRQLVTGLVVNEDSPSVPREARRRFRAILHNCRKNGVASQKREREDFESYLRGFAAYVHMVQPDLGKRWLAEVETLLAR